MNRLPTFILMESSHTRKTKHRWDSSWPNGDVAAFSLCQGNDVFLLGGNFFVVTGQDDKDVSLLLKTMYIFWELKEMPIEYMSR